MRRVEVESLDDVLGNIAQVLMEQSEESDSGPNGEDSLQRLERSDRSQACQMSAAYVFWRTVFCSGAGKWKGHSDTGILQRYQN